MPTSSTPVLPRGPHKLTREQVEASQRERIFVAMTEVVGVEGFAAASVADVVGAAGVSRATFYALFRDKDDCFTAAYGWAAERIAAVLEVAARTAATHADDDPFERLRTVLHAYLGSLAAAPGLARTFLVEVYAAGPEAIGQRHASLGLFVDLVADILGDRPGPFGNTPAQRFAVEALVSAVSSMVTHLVGTGRADELPALEAPLIALAHELAGITPSTPTGKDRRGHL